MNRLLITTGLAGTFALTPAVSAVETITLWNFNGPSTTAVLGGPNSPSPATGVGTASLVGGTTGDFASGTASGGSSDPVTTTPNNYGWQTTTYPAQSTANQTAGVQFAVPTTTFENLSLQFDLRSSNTSSRFFQVQVSTDGSTFSNVGTPARLRPADESAGDLWTNNITVDLTGVAGVNDNADFAFRVVSSFSPVAFTQFNTGDEFGPDVAYEAARNRPATSGANSNYLGGTWRFDMVTVSGTVIPEPATAGLLGLGGLTLLARRRRA